MTDFTFEKRLLNDVISGKLSEIEVVFRHWLCDSFHNYDLEYEPVQGTYGLVWFGTYRDPNAHRLSRFIDSHKIAIKTIDVNKLDKENWKDDLSDLQREFRIWRELPPSLNVISAKDMRICRLQAHLKTPFPVDLPVMVMPAMDGTLDDWINSDIHSYEDKLLALAQVINGLRFLYDRKRCTRHLFPLIKHCEKKGIHLTMENSYGISSSTPKCRRVVPHYC